MFVGPLVVATFLAALPLETAVAHVLNEFQVPGGAVAVLHRGRVVCLQGFGVCSLAQPDRVTPDTLFPLGSCTKAFTSAGVALLADRGRLTFDDPVRTHLPQFHLADPQADAQVTVRDLLSHRTGVDGHDLLWYRAPWSQTDAVKKLAHLPPSGPFRASYHYSSLQYLAVGEAVTAAAGTPWPRWVRTQLIELLGMHSVTFATPPPARSRAAGHHRTAAGTVEAMPEYTLAEPNAAGSMYASVRDLVPWMELQLGNGTYRGQRLVSAKNLLQTRTVQIAMPLTDPGIGPVYPLSRRVGYGMGWVVYDHRGLDVQAHGGVADGFRAQITLIPERELGIAVFTNLHQSKVNVAITNRLVDMMCGFQAIDWAKYFQQVEATAAANRTRALAARDAARGPVRPPTLPLASYAGTFTDPVYGPATVTAENGTLTWAWGGFRVRLAHYQTDTFRFTDGPFVDELATFRVVEQRVAALEAIARTFQAAP